MIKFGTLKSKIEKKLLESYQNNSFKEEIKNFKNTVLSNKKVAKLFYLYDELTTKKGLSESESKEFISETLSLIKENQITESDIKDIKKWVSKTKSTNDYKIVDDLLSENIDVEKIVKLKNKISEELKKPKDQIKTTVNVPIHSMVNIANQTLNKHLETLNESDRKEFQSIIKLSDEELVSEFAKNRSEVTAKLQNHITESLDEESKKKVLDTIETIKDKSINKLELFKLISLNKSL